MSETDTDQGTVASLHELCGAAGETSADCEDGAERMMTAGPASLCTRGEGADLMCALNATDGDPGVDRDAGTATDAALDAGSGGGGGCSVGASTSAAWLFSFLLLRRREQR